MNLAAEQNESQTNNNNQNSVHSKEDPMEIETLTKGEDRVIQEIPVYLVQTLMPNLSLWQFQLRKPWKEFPSAQAIRIKPVQCKVELDYQNDKVEENTDPNADITNSSHRLNSMKVPLRSNYVVGVIDIEKGMKEYGSKIFKYRLDWNFRKIDWLELIFHFES